MKSTFSIFVATTLLLASNSAEAARGTAAGSNKNLMLPPPPVISTAPPQTNPIGGTNTQSTPPGVLGSEFNPITGQSFGALSGQPGSPTFDPNAALPSRGNAGSPSTSP